MPQVIYENSMDNKSSSGSQEGAADIDEGAIVPFEPYVLIEGVLDKLKTKKESFLNLSFGKPKVCDYFLHFFFCF